MVHVPCSTDDVFTTEKLISLLATVNVRNHISIYLAQCACQLSEA